MRIKYANENDLKIINEYFEDSGRVYDESDNIAVFDNVLEITEYLYSDSIKELLFELNNRYIIDGNMTLLENLVDDLSNVFQSDDGTYYVIK